MFCHHCNGTGRLPDPPPRQSDIDGQREYLTERIAACREEIASYRTVAGLRRQQGNEVAARAREEHITDLERLIRQHEAALAALPT